MTRTDQPDSAEAGRSAALRNDVKRTGRQQRLYRKIAVSVLLTLALLALLFYGRERIERQDYYTAIQSLQHQIDEFQAEHRQLPRQEEFDGFELQKRTLSLLDIKYNIEHIMEESPPETILAYTPVLKSTFFANKHVVLFLDGQQKWLSSDELQEQLTQSEQLYNARMLPKLP